MEGIQNGQNKLKKEKQKVGGLTLFDLKTHDKATSNQKVCCRDKDGPIHETEARAQTQTLTFVVGGFSTRQCGKKGLSNKWC